MKYKLSYLFIMLAIMWTGCHISNTKSESPEDSNSITTCNIEMNYIDSGDSIISVENEGLIYKNKMLRLRSIQNKNYLIDTVLYKDNLLVDNPDNMILYKISDVINNDLCTASFRLATCIPDSDACRFFDFEYEGSFLVHEEVILVDH